MKITKIEPTPSPNTMKVILDEELPAGKSNNYKKEQANEAPPQLKEILEIEGVKGVYHVLDFIAVERSGRYDWKDILPKVRAVFGEEQENSSHSTVTQDNFGEVNVSVQTFKGIPLQVKLTDGEEEKRVGLPDRFTNAMKEAQLEGENYVLLREWEDYGIRYGELDQIAEVMVEEIMAAYPPERIEALVERAKNPQKNKQPLRREKIKLTPAQLDHSDWRKRYQLLDQMADPTLEDLPVLEKALADDKASIRRLAVVYLGMIEDKQVLPLLYKGLKDKAVTVRRTAGDSLSDLGYKEAVGAMMEALKDKSKIVRWRAAMFLYEVGDKEALPALKAAANDPEFEVQLQIKMAIERIEGGEEAKGSIWKQMTEMRQQNKDEEM